MIQTTKLQQATLLAIAERVLSGMEYDTENEMYCVAEGFVITMDKQLFQTIATLFDIEIPHIKKDQ